MTGVGNASERRSLVVLIEPFLTVCTESNSVERSRKLEILERPKVDLKSQDL